MSDHTNRNLHINPTYIENHVGGNQNVPPLNKQYIKSQLNLINKSKDYLPPFNYDDQFLNNRIYRQNNNNQFYNKYNINNANNKTNNTNINDTTDYNKNMNKVVYPEDRDTVNRYDPYSGYLYKYGLLDESGNKRRYKTYYLNIDSAYRVLQPIVKTDDCYLLQQNPLSFTKDSNVIKIYHKNNNYQDGDLITLTGAVGTGYTFRYNNDNISFEMRIGYGYIKFIAPITFDFGLANPINTEIKYNKNGNVQINGIQGDNIIGTESYLSNIPINLINNTHIAYPILGVSDTNNALNLGNPLWGNLISLDNDIVIYNPHIFYIVLPLALEGPYYSSLPDYNYKISFLSINSIPLNFINAEFPINPDRQFGYHQIQNVQNDCYDIVISDFVAANTILGGGSTIYVARINEILPGYTYPNNYIINLDKIYHDIVSIKLVSMEFPNTSNVINNSIGTANNKLYWNNLEDGNYLYDISIPPGNYTPSTLANEIQSLISQVPRINANTQNIPNVIFSPNHYANVSINTNTNVVSISMYKKYSLIQPISITDPDLSNLLNIVDGPVKITINHPNHGMITDNQTIIISGAIDTLGIPASVINGQHIVSLIYDSFNNPDPDFYTIEVPPFNLLSPRIDTKGGNSVNILIPNLFRLRFDKSDTLGKILGWRRPGDVYSITPYAKTITNQDSYFFDNTVDSFGNNITITNNIIQLSGDNYVYMEVNPLETYISNGPIKHAFAKILLCDIPNKVIFNSFVNMPLIFDDPLHELSQLEIIFYNRDGTLYNFNGADHSFTLEIITVNDVPKGTNISANTGKNYNIYSS